MQVHACKRSVHGLVLLQTVALFCCIGQVFLDNREFRAYLHTSCTPCVGREGGIVEALFVVFVIACSMLM